MAKIKIQSDVSDVKKSILGLSKDLKNLGQSKVALFTSEDRKFLKTELKRSLGEMHSQLNRNRTEIEKMLQAQKALVKGSKEETENRLKLLKAYKDQQTLFQKTQAMQARGVGGFGGSGGGGGGGLLKRGGAIGAGAVALGATAGMLGASLVGSAISATLGPGQRYAQGSNTRLGIQALGGRIIGRDREAALARVGLNDDEASQRMLSAGRTLGRAAGSEQNILQQAAFERSRGLEGATLLNTAGALQSTFGGKGADDAQRRLQASVIASGMEEGVGPYFEAMTGLLSSINENGLTSTEELISFMGQATARGTRTAQQEARGMQSLDQSLKNSEGSSNSFFQRAFSSQGIGGKSLGLTNAAMRSGGLTGESEEKLLQEYGPEFVAKAKALGLVGNAQERAGSIVGQFRKESGFKGDFSKISPEERERLGAYYSQLSGTGADPASSYENLRSLERLSKKSKLTKEEEQQIKDMTAGKSPKDVEDRLKNLNATLDGLTNITINTRASVEVSTGAKGGAKVYSAAVEADTSRLRLQGAALQKADSTGSLDFAKGAAQGAANAALGALPGSENLPRPSNAQARGAEFVESAPASLVESLKSLANALATPRGRGGEVTNVKILNGDGSVTNTTTRK